MEGECWSLLLLAYFFINYQTDEPPVATEKQTNKHDVLVFSFQNDPKGSVGRPAAAVDKFIWEPAAAAKQVVTWEHWPSATGCLTSQKRKKKTLIKQDGKKSPLHFWTDGARYVKLLVITGHIARGRRRKSGSLSSFIFLLVRMSSLYFLLFFPFNVLLQYSGPSWWSV